MKYAVLVLAALAVLSCSPQPPKVVFATDATWAPMESFNDSKELVGYDVDLARELARQAGFTAEFRPVAWDSLFSGLTEGRYDAVISAVTVSDERRARYDFTQPYLNAGQVLVVPTASRAAQLSDLKGKPVGVQIGTEGAAVAEKVLGPGASLRTFDQIGLAFADLAAGRLAGVVAETSVAAQFAVLSHRYQGAFKVVGPPLTGENYAIAVKKGNQRLLDLLNRALTQVQASGFTDTLAARWLR